MDHRCSVGDRWPLRVPNRRKRREDTQRASEKERTRNRRAELPGAVLSYSLRSSGNAAKRRRRRETDPTVVSLSRKICSLSLSPLLPFPLDLLSYSLALCPSSRTQGSRGRKSRNGSSSLDDARDSPVPLLPLSLTHSTDLYRPPSLICPRRWTDTERLARSETLQHHMTSTDFVGS